jgi:hypothetical protein
MTEGHGRRRLIIGCDGAPTHPSGWVSRATAGRTPFDAWLRLLA